MIVWLDYDPRRGKLRRETELYVGYRIKLARRVESIGYRRA